MSKKVSIVHVSSVFQKGVVNFIVGCGFRGRDVIKSLGQSVQCRGRQVFIGEVDNGTGVKGFFYFFVYFVFA